ncbi:hypothetical protein HETIRDRAFT_107824 [Heterobasidion irregulare TC 32-1]|uniref:Uncharacterized protein n=1 Tax=Heterobasidion irregulare (strain TC 32-1) TaxID=747525 RepID=W4JXE3_HETIT|nr:uncharacterized protein HETIRDRAFT_107824 [Heterobasidion irregulare TC 32-1]ETW78232.1 hypothetical protein HETIRDRAFT_107824 [Heterobasidion irregulare TC 32-1]
MLGSEESTEKYEILYSCDRRSKPPDFKQPFAHTLQMASFVPLGLDDIETTIIHKATWIEAAELTLDRHAAKSEALNELKLLSNIIDPSWERDPPSCHIQLVIYFDEAHELASRAAPGNKYDKSLYDTVLSVLNDFVSYPLFAIFLSTILHVARCPPSQDFASSSRAARESLLQAPVTETPFDCAPDFVVKPHGLRLGDAYAHLQTLKICF